MHDGRGSSSTFPRPAIQAWLQSRLAEVQRGRTGTLVALRGRRQAGKSTAVEQFVQSAGTPYVYVTGLYRMPEHTQLEAAAAAFAESRSPIRIDLPGVPGSWQEWFGRIALAAAHGPVIAVLDEFPWMTAGDSAGLEGLLQAVWDRVLEKLPVLLILVGSDLAMMERLVQHDRPLFGRVREFVVPALNPSEVASALPGAAPFEVFDAYLATGGYPRLVEDLRRSGDDARAWVRRSFEDDLSPLVATGRLTLDAEFPDGNAAYRVLSAIGASEPARLGLGGIVESIADPGAPEKTVQTAAQRALTLLADEKRLVERELPAWATTSRLRRYRIADPYLRFWFRYVERQIDTVSRGRGDIAAAAFDRDWPSWRGRAIEPIVRASLVRLGGVDERLRGVESASAWWTRDGEVEVDVVAGGRERTEFLGTIKWRRRGGIDPRDLAELSSHRARIPRSEAAGLLAISPTGAAPTGTDLSLSASDLLDAWSVR